MTGRNVNINRIIGGNVIRVNGTITEATVLKLDYRLKKRSVFDKSKGEEVMS